MTLLQVFLVNFAASYCNVSMTLFWILHVTFAGSCTTFLRVFRVAVIHLSMSIPTYPRSGNGWGFVVICQHNLSPGLGHLSKNFHCFWNPYTNGGDLQHKIVPRGGKFVKQLLQIPNNPHPCSTWGRWGVTMIGASRLRAALSARLFSKAS